MPCRRSTIARPAGVSIHPAPARTTSRAKSAWARPAQPEFLTCAAARRQRARAGRISISTRRTGVLEAEAAATSSLRRAPPAAAGRDRSLINATAQSYMQASLDVRDGNDGMVIGADGGAYTLTNNTNKAGRISVQHYTSSTQPAVALISGFTYSGVNDVDIGGGTGVLNAATGLHFFTAVNSTTTTGTERMTINSTGTSASAPPALSASWTWRGRSSWPTAAKAVTWRMTPA
jgi:hypothetical protein